MKQEIFEELKDLKSTLIDIKDKDTFKAPDGYFDKMQKSVLIKIKENKSNNKVIRIEKKKLWGIGIAAAVVVIIGVSFLMTQNTTSIDIDDISYEESYDYLIDNLDELDEETISYAISELQIDIDESNDSEDILDYIEENIDDITEEDINQIF